VNNIAETFSSRFVNSATQGAYPEVAGSARVPLLTQYLRIAIRWKWVIGGAIAASLIIALVVTLLMTPQYTAISKIEISREQDKIVKVEGVEQENNAANLEFYQTQYGLLQSITLSKRVVGELKLADDASFYALFGETPAGAAAANANGVFGSTDRDQRIAQASDILLENLAISPIRGSSLVEVQFTSPNPSLSAKIANAWTKNFIENSLERRFEATSYARNFLENRLQTLRQRLEESERLLVGYAARQRILNIPISGPTGSGTAERSILAEDLASLNEELNAATADRIKAESRLRQAPSGTGSSAEALANVAIGGLRQKRAEVAAEYAKVMSQFEADYPPAKALESQLAQLDRSIAREERRISDSLRTAYDQSTARERDLAGRVETLKSSLVDQRRRSIQYNIYQREVDTNRQLYDGLLQRYKEIGIAGGVGTNNVSVVDAAEPPEKPTSPRMIINLLLALIFGSVLGAGLAFAFEQIDETIADPSQVEPLLGVPLLGAVPDTGDVDPQTALSDRKSPVVEAYISVQTNLEFSTTHGVPRSLMVTSTRPAEGKSTSAYALAGALARSRRKTVLVDGDMRSPSVHGLFGETNVHGLSSVLSGQEKLGAVIRSTSFDSLFIVPAGPLPPNAAELLVGDRLDEVLKQLLAEFDHVVIDAPPVMGLADAPLLSSKVEGVVFAVESHAIRASLVKTAIERLRAANARILGVVLTKFEAKRAHFGYGYEYGYGYGEEKRA
jgi:polysaccharide biosynthesis transport protein